MVSYITQKIRNIFSKQAKETVLASYDSAQTTVSNINHWKNADHLGAMASSNREVRKIIRSRARYECVENNCYLKGMVASLANATVGKGPRLQLNSDNPETDKIIEKAFRNWAKEIKLSAKLRLMRKARCYDGESFMIFKNNPHSMNGVKLDVKVLECDLVSDENEPETEENADGVLFQDGYPVAYKLLQKHPSSSFEAKHKLEASERVIHYFLEARPGQLRGVSELAAALPLIALLRRYTLAVTQTAETGASFGGVITSDAGDAYEFADYTGEEIELQHNMFLTLAEGQKITQFKAEQPTQSYDAFVRQLLSEIARCILMPLNVALGDSSKFNFASGRLDYQMFQKAVEIERDEMESTILNRVFKAWLTEASLRRIIPIEAPEIATWSIDWVWDGVEMFDPVKEANASKILKDEAFSTLQKECAKRGEDWRDVMEQRAREQEFANELGLSIGGDIAPTDKEESEETEPETKDEDSAKKEPAEAT